MSEASLSVGRQRVGAFQKRSRVEKIPLDIRMQWNAGTACVSECVLKTLACQGLRVGPSIFSRTFEAFILRVRKYPTKLQEGQGLSSGEVRGTSRQVWETCGEPLLFKATVREVPGKSLRNFR